MKTKFIDRDLIATAIAFTFMVLFLYAAMIKIMDYTTFKAQMGKSPFILNYASVLAWLVPAVEILVAILLIIPKLRLIGFYFAFTTMLGFSLYIALMLLFSPSLPCSCGGILNSMGWAEHLAFNIVFTILAALATIIITNPPNKNVSTTLL